MKTFSLFLLAGFCFCRAAVAQTTPVPDTSGNAQLDGAYNFRQVSYYVTDALGTLSRSTALFGTITFDGAGNYTINGSLLDSIAPPAAATPYAKTGTYGIGANGQGTIDGPLASTDRIFGLVANGIFIGSSTASNFNDLFIAAPATPAATVATLNGAYAMATIGFPSTDPTAAMSAWFQGTADGVGNLGAITVNGHLAGSAATLQTLAYPAVTYTFTNGVGTLSFPPLPSTATSAASVFMSGNRTVYLSPDGKFLFGGSTTGWDMLIGVNAVLPPPSTQSFSGLYYQAGLDQDVSQSASGITTLAGYYGSLNTSETLTIAHQHLNSLPVSAPYDYTFHDSYTLNSDGTYADATLGATYVLGTDGIRIGYDTGLALGLNIAMPAPVMSGSGVYLNPQGAVNAASFAPFTAGVAPGELITLFGTNLSPAAEVATSLPVSGELGQVQVLFNGVPAPVIYASPTGISAIVPYDLAGQGTASPIANVQVISNGISSNILTLNIRTTAPGIFTFPADGLGSGAALHLDYSLVTTANPAQAGETLAVFMDGLGAVSPVATAGNAGSSMPLSEVPSGSIGMLIDGQAATVTFAGLAPGFAGLYQVNVQVPTGIHSGDVLLAVAGPDSLTSEATLPVAAGTDTIGPASRPGMKIGSRGRQ